jgi:hypothetical protein
MPAVEAARIAAREHIDRTYALLRVHWTAGG